MEYLVLNSYLKFMDENKTGWISFIKSMRPLHKTLFFTMILSALCSAILSFISIRNSNIIIRIIMLSGVLIEFISVLVIGKTVDKESIQKSKESIEKRDNHYDKLILWLKGIGYTEKNQIMMICQRCRIEVHNNDSRNIKRVKFIDQVFTLFFIPIYAAIISWLFGLGGESNETIANIIVTGFVGIVLYIGTFGLNEFFKPFTDSTYIKMSKMVRDIQGMLDRKFQISDDDVKQASL